MKPRVLSITLLLPALLCLAGLVMAAPVSHLSVRVVNGGQELPANSDLELRIYEVSGGVRKLPLSHGETWLPDSTHLIPLQLDQSLDPRNVMRFALYYRAPSALAPALEIISADVEVTEIGHAPAKLLDATLSGIIPRQGELATVERTAVACVSDADCDDHKTCNGKERCAPRSPGADARGCVKGQPVSCPVNQVCGEGIGCHGTDALKKFNGDDSKP